MDVGTNALTRHSAHKTTGLDAIPGKKVVWNPSGHYHLTQMGVYFVKHGMDGAGFRKLPPELAEMLTWICGIEGDVVLQDITWANLAGKFGYNPKGGQILHFMKDEGQDDLEAYKLSKDLILKEGGDAAGGFRRCYLFMVEHPLSYKVLGAPETDYISWHLSASLHTLQDSFSPAHTLRDESNDYAIEEIHAWDENNKVTHDKNDTLWKETSLGQAAELASASLIKCAVLSAVASDAKKAFLDLAEEQVVKKYLKTSFTAIG